MVRLDRTIALNIVLILIWSGVLMQMVRSSRTMT